MTGNFQRHIHHIQRIHSHPAGAIGLLQLSAFCKVMAPVEHTNIIKPQKAAFKNIITAPILSIDPPGKIDKQFLKHPF